MPSPALRPASAGGRFRRATPAAPIAIATPARPGSRGSGRFIAVVSRPRRAATFAAATTSAFEGASPSTSAASTKSTTPSPLRSWSSAPVFRMPERSGPAASVLRAGACRSSTSPASSEGRKALRIDETSAGTGRPGRRAARPAARATSELVADRQLELPRRRVDVRQQRRGLAEDGGLDAVGRDGVVLPVGDVEELRDELDSMLLRRRL